LDKNHITSQNMGDSKYIFTTQYLFFLKAWRRNTQCDNKNLSHECYHIDIKENM
jgi:hypothetical protein